MSEFLKAVGLISTPPGSYAYQLLVLGVVALVAGLFAAIWWGARHRPGAAGASSNWALAFGGLAIVRLAALAVTLVTSSGSTIASLAPSLDRAISTLTAIIFGLALAFPAPRRQIWWALIATVLALGAAFGASWFLWAEAVAHGSRYFNGSLQDSIWAAAQSAVLAGALIVIGVRRPRGWLAAAGLMAILLIAQALHYLFPIADVDVPGAVRLAEVVVWPLTAVVLLSRFLLPANDSSRAASRAQDQPPAEKPAEVPPFTSAQASVVATPVPMPPAALAVVEPPATPANAFSVELETRLQTQAKQHGALLKAFQEAQNHILQARSALQVQQANWFASQEALQTLAQQNRLLTQMTEADKMALEAAGQVSAEQQQALEYTRRQQLDLQASIQAAQDDLKQDVEQNQKFAAQMLGPQTSRSSPDNENHGPNAESTEQAKRLATLEQQLKEKERLLAVLRVELRRRTEGLPAGDAAQPPELVKTAVSDNGRTSNRVDGRQPAGQGAKVQTGPLTPAGLSKAMEGERPTLTTAVEIGLRPDLARLSTSELCPRLGLTNDPDTRHAFTSVANRCYALNTPAELSHAQQDKFCLCANYTTCPVFTGQIQSPRRPIDTEAELKPDSQHNRPGDRRRGAKV